MRTYESTDIRPGFLVCRICGPDVLFAYPEDKETHKKEHSKLAKGILPHHVREYIKKCAWRLVYDKADFSKQLDDPQFIDSAKVSAALARWNMQIELKQSGKKEPIRVTDFESFMEKMLEQIDKDHIHSQKINTPT